MASWYVSVLGTPSYDPTLTFVHPNASVLGKPAIFNGTASYNMPSGNEAYITNGDFTVEAWVYNTQPGVSAANTVAATSEWALYITNGNQLRRVTQNKAIVNSGTTLVPKNVWTHVAAVRSNGIVTLYVNGVSSGSGAVGAYAATSATALRVGGGGKTDPATEAWYGYLDEVRITKGVARYLSNFTPSVTPFPDN